MRGKKINKHHNTKYYYKKEKQIRPYYPPGRDAVTDIKMAMGYKLLSYYASITGGENYED